jgi:hypothetical protein
VRKIIPDNVYFIHEGHYGSRKESVCAVCSLWIKSCLVKTFEVSKTSKVCLPDILWVALPAGTLLMGSRQGETFTTPKGQKKPRDDEYWPPSPLLVGEGLGVREAGRAPFPSKPFT